MKTALPASILVVDDDADIREMIVRQLKQATFDATGAGDIAEMRAALQDRPVDLVVLDLNLPDGDGLAVCRELRADGFAAAVIMVTARDSAIDRVLGLELGADDYLTKPFEPRELLARIRNLLRRMQAPETAKRVANTVKFGPWRLNRLNRRLIGPDEGIVMLSSSEYRLLDRFVESPNTVLSREELLPERRQTVAYDRSIDLQISRLRQKLALAPGGEDLILTVRSQGYLLAASVDAE
ncbi:two-component system OmpR family response regulator [Rhizomicrobium palustre]|uniref:Two-component system OmpR family response regulator n=1 Tax=Rhizomicrobium palustre TaxID=189966 RepID=A0A846MUN2_9PROT|nr:response regulator transcription factor [Rhizomicrobium palustre]NIK86822.1 two-component system OmpR family response regulator [Rhizomicrobium palustre]